MISAGEPSPSRCSKEISPSLAEGIAARTRKASLQTMRAIALAQGFVEGENFLSVVADGHSHQEFFWAQRTPDILRFLVDAPRACPRDLDRDGTVGFMDLLTLLANWGPCNACPEDLDGSGTLDFADVLLVLSAWGPCD